MISALADAGAVLASARLPRRRGRAPPSSSLRDLRDDDGRLLRTYNRGRAQLTAYLEDHAFLLEALLTLYEATFDAALVRRGARARRRRSSSASPTPSAAASSPPRADHEALIARRKDLEDAPIPSGGSAAASGCCGSPRLTGEARYEDAALGHDRAAARDRAAAPGGVRPPAAGDRLPRSPTCARSRSSATTADRSSGSCARQFRPHVVLAGGGGRRPAARGPRAGRRPRRRLRVRALRLPAAGDRAGRAARAAGD